MIDLRFLFFAWCFGAVYWGIIFLIYYVFNKLKGVQKMTKCNHENKMFPVSDSNGWNVGLLCDCGYFQVRTDMPDYEGRREASIKFREKVKELKGVQK